MPTREIASFWEETRNTLVQVRMDAVMEPVDQTDVFSMEGDMKTRRIYSVAMTSLEGTRIRAWYAVPTGEPPGRGWPAILVVPGYDSVMPLPLHLVQFGYATLSLYPRGQGESEKEWQVGYGTPLVYNVEDRERYYYRGGVHGLRAWARLPAESP